MVDLDNLEKQRVALKRTLAKIQREKPPGYEDRVANIEAWLAELNREIMEVRDAHRT
ncbi:hypothetical protein [Mesorhizobium sp. B2-8-9]|uniref:hypothetical protein n=1 Tax=Mesorhizobium sp. B2-8-9 TaxID=2589899 RepID=UPI0015E3CC6D|nr:hypothetical protein [Mesorhizobium sp. B2-8-9]